MRVYSFRYTMFDWTSVMQWYQSPLSSIKRLISAGFSNLNNLLMSNHPLPRCLEAHSRQNVCALFLLLILSNHARETRSLRDIYRGIFKYLSICWSCLFGGAFGAYSEFCDKKMELRFEV